jgi:ribonuclease HI
MELRAAIEGLGALKRPCAVRLFCDSRYVVQGIAEWLEGWKQRGWRKADGGPVLNAELWQQLDALLQVHSVKAIWVRGHAGHAENERVDKLARAQALEVAARTLEEDGGQGASGTESCGASTQKAAKTSPRKNH